MRCAALQVINPGSVEMWKFGNVEMSIDYLRAAACKDREFAVNDQILRIALILPKTPHW